jgi:hypothetical protein
VRAIRSTPESEMKRGNLNSMTSVRKRLIGIWRLLSFDMAVDGNVSQPYGEAPIGRLTYDDAGRMSAQLMKPGRKSSIDDPSEVANANCDELRQIADGYAGYYGTFTLDEESNTVIHHVEACTLPAWVGTAQTRQYEFVGAHLVLRAGSSKLVWERLPD